MPLHYSIRCILQDLQVVCTLARVVSILSALVIYRCLSASFPYCTIRILSIVIQIFHYSTKYYSFDKMGGQCDVITSEYKNFFWSEYRKEHFRNEDVRIKVVRSTQQLGRSRQYVVLYSTQYVELVFVLYTLQVQ